jgi:hypothetical protein
MESSAMEPSATLLTPGLAEYVRARGGELTITVRPYVIG